MLLLNSILHEKREDFLSYFSDKNLLKEFLYTYPAFSWLLRFLAPNECTWGFYIFHGIYLKDIPMKEEYIHYIADEETAQKLYSSYGHLGNASFLKKAVEKYYNARPICLVGALYWLNMYSEGLLFQKNPYIIIRADNISLARLLLPNNRTWWSEEKVDLIHLIMTYSSEPMLNYLLENSHVFTESMIKDLLKYSMIHAALSLFNSCKKQISKRNLSIQFNTKFVLSSRLLLRNSVESAKKSLTFLKKNSSIRRADVGGLVRNKKYEIIELFLREGSFYFTNNKVFGKIILEEAIYQENLSLSVTCISIHKIHVTDKMITNAIKNQRSDILTFLLTAVANNSSIILSEFTLHKIKKEKERIEKIIREYETLLHLTSHVLSAKE